MCIFLTILMCILTFKILLYNVKDEIVQANGIEKREKVVQASHEQKQSKIGRFFSKFFINKAVTAIEVNYKKQKENNIYSDIFKIILRKFTLFDYQDPRTLFQVEISLLNEMDDLAEAEEYFASEGFKKSIDKKNQNNIKGQNTKNSDKNQNSIEQKTNNNTNAADSSGQQLKKDKKDTVDIVTSSAKMPKKLALDNDKPVIFIYHTHATESYIPETSGNFHSLDRQYTVRAVGDVLTEQLTKKGYQVIHDDTVHDYPSYQQSYARSLQTLQDNLKNASSLKIIFDIHRDAPPEGKNTSQKSCVAIDNKKVARFSTVVGTGNPNAQALQTFAEYIKAKSDERYPGLAKGVIYKPYKFNQYNSDYYALLEIGDTANHIDESLRTATYLAEIIDEVIKDLKK